MDETMELNSLSSEESGDAAESTALLPDSAEAYQLTFATETKVDTDLLSQFQQFAFDNKIPLKQAQALASAYEKRMQTAMAAQREGWRQQVLNDPEFMRDKEANMAALDRVLAVFGNKDTRDELDLSGLGNHPFFVKMLTNIGKALKEPAFVRSGSGAGAEEPDNLQLINDAWAAAKQ